MSETKDVAPPEREKKAEKILADYVLPFSEIDGGNLYFAAMEFRHLLAEERKRAEGLVAALEKIYTESKDGTRRGCHILMGDWAYQAIEIYRKGVTK